MTNIKKEVVVPRLILGCSDTLYADIGNKLDEDIEIQLVDDNDEGIANEMIICEIWTKRRADENTADIISPFFRTDSRGFAYINFRMPAAIRVNIWFFAVVDDAIPVIMKVLPRGLQVIGAAPLHPHDPEEPPPDIRSLEFVPNGIEQITAEMPALKRWLVRQPRLMNEMDRSKKAIPKTPGKAFRWLVSLGVIALLGFFCGVVLVICCSLGIHWWVTNENTPQRATLPIQASSPDTDGLEIQPPQTRPTMKPGIKLGAQTEVEPTEEFACEKWLHALPGGKMKVTKCIGFPAELALACSYEFDPETMVIKLTTDCHPLP